MLKDIALSVIMLAGQQHTHRHQPDHFHVAPTRYCHRPPTRPINLYRRL